MGMFSSALCILFERRRNRGGFAACGVVKLLLCLLLPLGASVGVWGQAQPSLNLRYTCEGLGEDNTTYCSGSGVAAVVYVGWTSEPGYSTPTVEWTADGDPLSGGDSWSAAYNKLTIAPSVSTKYVGTFKYTYKGLPYTDPPLVLDVKVVQKPTIELKPSYENGASNSLCGSPAAVSLKVNGDDFNPDIWNVTNGVGSKYNFESESFLYKGVGPSENPEEESFSFSVKHKKNSGCASDFNAKVKVYKPKDIEVNLGGTFCADAKPISGSFASSPTDADGTYKITLSNLTESSIALNGVNRADAEVYKVIDAGQYSLTVNYSYPMDGTPKECPSEPVAKDFRVVSVPSAPKWEQAGPLSLCGKTDVKVNSVDNPADGVDYEYTLNPRGTVVPWRKDGGAVSFDISEAGSYKVGLKLKNVKLCPDNLISSPLEVKMQGTLEGIPAPAATPVVLCQDVGQAINGDQKIGFQTISEQGKAGDPVGYKYQWVRLNGNFGESVADLNAARELTIKKNLEVTGQPKLTPKEGNNSYKLRYKLEDANKACWRGLDHEFKVHVTPAIVNTIVSDKSGVCRGVEATVKNMKLGGGDGQFAAKWFKGTEESGGTDPAKYVGTITAGIYKREMTSGGCKSSSNEVKVIQLAEPMLTYTKVDPRCWESKDGEITATAAVSGNTKVAFSFDGGKEYESFGPPNSSRTMNGCGINTKYTVVVKTEGDGCLSEAKEVQFDVPEFVVHVDPTGAECWGADGKVKVSWEGGKIRSGDKYYVSLENRPGGNQLEHDLPGTDKSWGKTDIKEGEYVVQVSYPGKNGACKAKKEFSVTEPAPVELKPFKVLCPGGQDGMIQAKVENATGARYVLEKDSASVWPVVEGNYDGLFIGLPEGTYRVRVSLPGGKKCETTSKEVEVKGEKLALSLKPSSVNVKCPGEVIEYIEAQSTPATVFANYIWGREVKGKSSYITTKGAKLLDAVAGKYTLTAVREDGCVVESDTLDVKGPFPFAWIKDPLTTPAECKDYRGNDESRGTATLYGVEGGANAQAWWLTTSNPEDVGQPLVYDHQYALRSGVWMVRVKDDNGCAGELDVTVGYNPANSVSFTLHRDKLGGSLCFGERVSGARIVEDPSSVSKIDYTVPPIITLERREGGVLLADTLVREEDGSYTSRRGVERSSTLRAVVQSTAGCRSEETSNVLVFPPIKLQYDPLASDIDIFYHQEVVDAKRSWKDASGRMVYRVMKDSIVAGVLSGVPRKVGIEVDYLQGMHGDLSYTVAPDDVLTLDKERKNVFEITLSPEAMDRYRAEGRVVAAQFGRKPIDVLRTTIRVADPKTTCATDFDLYVRLIRELSIPNVFTPNGDGVNDRWLCNSDPTYQTIFSKLTSLLPNMEVEVFNRAGARVWRAKGEQVAEGWDGSAGGVYGGSPLPVGTYYYVIRFNTEGGNSWKPISGSVTIVR